MQSIEFAGYQCEVNPIHETFIAKSTGRPYMEGHHALPMMHQGKFEKRIPSFCSSLKYLAGL